MIGSSRRRGAGPRLRSSFRDREASVPRGWWLVAALVPLILVAPLAAPHPSPTQTAYAANFHKCNTVKKARQFEIKKIKVTRPISCGNARGVTKKWVQRKFDQNNAIGRGGRNWFCTWRKRDPMSINTGTADCEAGAADEIRFLVRKR